MTANPDLGIEGRGAAVAAGSAGLGLAVATALARAGAHTAICGRDRERAEAAARRIGHETVPLVCDVGDSDGGIEFVDRATEALGQVDILVSNGGGPPPGDFADTDVGAYPPALDMNLLSVVGMCRAAVPAMQDRGWGRVVAITSVAVRQPIPFLILSNTARTGLTGFLKTLALEVAPDGVTVNSVQPGAHATDRLLSLPEESVDALRDDVPGGRLGDPDHFGRMVAFLCSEWADFVTGAALPVDGGAHRGLQ